MDILYIPKTHLSTVNILQLKASHVFLKQEENLGLA